MTGPFHDRDPDPARARSGLSDGLSLTAIPSDKAGMAKHSPASLHRAAPSRGARTARGGASALTANKRRDRCALAPRAERPSMIFEDGCSPLTAAAVLSPGTAGK
jgi:hypothetical protein